MYNGIKAQIKFNGDLSETFSCQLGVRQGENLSPFLFSIYLNDLESFLETNKIEGLQQISELFLNELQMYEKLLLMLYADDTIIFAESPEKLQNALTCFEEYCNLWKLKVNTDKTKIMIFGKSNKNKGSFSFTYGGSNIEIVDSFKYLGVIFTNSRNFKVNIKERFDKATRAMFNVLAKCKEHNLSIDCQLDLFDKIIQPILLYGCEVWGFTKNTFTEKLHLKFCKYILNLSSKTTNGMVYGELGRYSLLVAIKVRMISFWAKLHFSPDIEKLSVRIYHLVYREIFNG